MTAFMGYSLIVIFMILIMTKKMLFFKIFCTIVMRMFFIWESFLTFQLFYSIISILAHDS